MNCTHEGATSDSRCTLMAIAGEFLKLRFKMCWTWYQDSFHLNIFANVPTREGQRFKICNIDL